MPELYGDPSVLGASTMPADLLAACVTALGSDSEVGVDGTLGIVTREIRRPQLGSAAKKQPFKRADLPAIVLWGEIVTAADPILCGVSQMVVRVHIGVTVRAADLQDGEADNLAIQGRAMMVLAKKRWDTDFPTDTMQCNTDVLGTSATPPEVSEKEPTEVVSEATVDFALMYAEVG